MQISKFANHKLTKLLLSNYIPERSIIVHDARIDNPQYKNSIKITRSGNGYIFSYSMCNLRPLQGELSDFHKILKKALKYHEDLFDKKAPRDTI